MLETLEGRRLLSAVVIHGEDITQQLNLNGMTQNGGTVDFTGDYQDVSRLPAEGGGHQFTFVKTETGEKFKVFAQHEAGYVKIMATWANGEKFVYDSRVGEDGVGGAYGVKVTTDPILPAEPPADIVTAADLEEEPLV